jgi:hypothetical protein
LLDSPDNIARRRRYLYMLYSIEVSQKIETNRLGNNQIIKL